MNKSRRTSFFAFQLTRQQFSILVILGFLGIALAVFAFISLDHLEKEKINAELMRTAGNVVQNLQERVDDNLDEVVSLESFYLSSEHVTQQEFAIFAQSIMRHEKGIQALEWIPYVARSERQVFEERARQDGHTGFVITERKEQGVMMPASEREAFFPVYYVEPLEGNEKALGFDLASNTARLEVMELSRDTGLMKATSPITLVQEKDKKIAVLAFLPIYQNGKVTDSVAERRKELQGFVLGIFRVEDLLEDAMSGISPQRLDIYIYEKEPHDKSDGFISYHASSARTGNVAALLEKSRLLQGKHYVLPVTVADKTWLLYFMPIPEFYSELRSWEVWGVPGIILIFGALLLGYFIIILEREERARRHAFDISRAKDALESEAAERQQTEEALRLSEERYRGFVQNFAGIAYRGILENFTPVFFHGAVEVITGYTEEELTRGDPRWDHIIYPADLPKVLSDEKITLQPDYSFEREYRIVRKDGGIHWINEVGRNICDSSGVPKYIESIIYDITRRRKLEEDIQRSRKIESVGVLAGGIAHDFNNILMAILGNISLAKMSLDPEDRPHSLLGQAEKASLRARDLTQQLLTFSKGGEPVKELAEISEVIKDSADFVIRGSKVRCDYHFALDLWPAEIDRGQISQVIQNIVLNASHAMPEGGIVKINCLNLAWDKKQTLFQQLESPVLETGKYLKITIEDSGIGIPPELLDKIFDPYFTTKSEGSGLGLAICHSIIKNHQGNISVQSDPGGTSFVIYLPASTSQQKPVSKDEEEVQADIKARILVMDDQEIVRETVKSLLTQLGHESIMAADGVEAIRLYRESFSSESHIDLIIMDLTVPGGMGGEEAVKEILKINPEARVIVTSGYSNNPVMANYSQYGFCSAVIKPYRINEVRRAIIQALS
jgi:PAS domain S-box-containing protein